jgi:hypothetical protein
MKIFIDPSYLAGLARSLDAAAEGLAAARTQLSREAMPSMPASTARSVESAITRSRSTLEGVRGECRAMAKQLRERMKFDPPEAFPTFEPTARLTQDAIARAKSLARRFRDGKAHIGDDMKFAEDEELQLQLYIELGDVDFDRYVKQAAARFELARDLVNERTWKERKDQDIEAWTQGHEDWMARHRLGWAYPKGFSTGWFKGGAALDAAAYSLYGMVRDQFGDERKRTWAGLGLDTHTEAATKAIAHSLRHPEEFLKALTAWDTFAAGKIGEGLGEVSFTVATIWATGGVGSAGAAVKSGQTALQSWRTQSLAYGAMRRAAKAADGLEAEVQRMRRLAAESRSGTDTPGGRDRNVNFETTGAARRDAEAARLAAAQLRQQAAEAFDKLGAAHQQFLGSAGRAVLHTLAVAGLDLTDIRSVTAWLNNAWSLHSSSQPSAPKPPKDLEFDLQQASDAEKEPRS